MKITHLATLALAVGISATSVAETTYGEPILNTATLNFKVNDKDQIEQSAAASFLVDRKVIVNVTNGASTIGSALVGTAQVITYTISNLSNAPLGMKFSVDDLIAEEEIYPGQYPDDTNGPAITYAMYVDSNNNIYESATDTTQVAQNGQLEFNQLGNAGINPDTIVIHVIATPTEGVDSNVFAHDLVVTAVEPTSGTPLPNNNADAWDDGVVQTILKDNSPIVKGRGGISISSATLTPTKKATVVSDPINGSSNPKAVPGAIIKYEIKVANSGSVAATDLVIEDILPAEFNLQQDIADNVAVFTINGTTTAPGSVAGTDIIVDGNKVTFPPMTVPANAEVTVTITVKLL